MEEILKSLRQLLIEHLATNESLIAQANVGEDIIVVGNSSRYRLNDDVLVMSQITDEADQSYSSISKIFSYRTQAELLSEFGITAATGGYPMQLSVPLASTWPLSESPSVLKACGHQPLKRVVIGDLRPLPDFPIITLSQSSEDNEWFTMRSTSHEYKIAIKTYIMADNFENSEILIARLSQNIREILIEHIHPIVNGEYHDLTADLLQDGTVVQVADTSNFRVGGTVFVRSADIKPEQPLDPYDLVKLRSASQENVIRTILSPNHMELVNPAHFDYRADRRAQIILINRYIYDSRPSSISYMYSPGQGGSFLRASEISWFGKEQIFREGNIVS